MSRKKVIILTLVIIGLIAGVTYYSRNSGPYISNPSTGAYNDTDLYQLH